MNYYWYSNWNRILHSATPKTSQSRVEKYVALYEILYHEHTVGNNHPKQKRFASSSKELRSTKSDCAINFWNLAKY